MRFTVCDLGAVTTKTQGYGFWSNRMTARSLSNQADDPKPMLERNETPVLIVRGVCDYKSADVAAQYDAVFPRSTLVVLEDAGHMPYWEKPDAFLEVVREFLSSE